MAQSRTEKDISKYSVHMGAARFQLTYMGPYLFREERSDPDPRVQHFIPDTWQVFTEKICSLRKRRNLMEAVGLDLSVCNKFWKWKSL